MKEKLSISEQLSDTYGSPENFALLLYSGIEMLFYLEEGSFDRRKVQNVVSAFGDVISLLRDKGWELVD